MVLAVEPESFEFRKYPSTRDAKVKNVYTWLAGKQNDDDVDNLWRIHDKLYDLSVWIDLHPGGSEWISVTRGTDITEAFEVHHPNIDLARKMLKQYEVKPTQNIRNSPFTFEKGGFYDTVRERAYPVIKRVGSGPTKAMNAIADSIFILFLMLSLLAVYFGSILLSLVSGVSLAMLCVCAHNYFHKKNNWRMFYFDCGMLSSHEWRISHALSHHLFANTLLDVEVSAIEPLLQFLPKEQKSVIARFMVILYSNIIYWIILPLQFTMKWVGVARGKVQARKENFLPLLHLILCLAVGLCSHSLSRVFVCWLLIHMACSYWFVFVGLIAAHHHPDIWHHGDELRYKSNDWGIRQIEAVRDRKDVTGNLFLVVTLFGDHTLHHLFPTVDHSKLKHLYPVLLETCQEFNIDFELYSIPSLLIGKYQQLARNQPRKFSP